MKRWLIAILCGLSLGIAAAERPQDFGATASVTPASGDGLQRLHLPLAVLQQSRAPGLADVRIFNAAGESLPIARFSTPIEAPARTTVLPMFQWPAPRSAGSPGAVKVEINAAGAVVRIDGRAPIATSASRTWLLDLSARRDDETLEAIELAWAAPPGGTSTRARIEGSDDLRQWQAAGAGPLLVLPAMASGMQAVEHRRLQPTGSFKYLRITLDDALPLTRVSAHWRTAATTPSDSARLRFNAVADADPPAWELDAGAPLALTRLRVTLPQPNSVLVLHVEQRARDSAAWQRIGTHTVYRFVRDGREIESTPIELGASVAARYWRLSLDARSPRIDVPILEAELTWPRQALAFAARAPAPFTLAVGRERSPDRALALSTLLPGWRAGDENRLPAASLGPVMPQQIAPPSVAERLRDASPQDRRRWLLWAVLAAAVLGLAWLARSLVRDVVTRPAQHDGAGETKG